MVILLKLMNLNVSSDSLQARSLASKIPSSFLSPILARNKLVGGQLCCEIRKPEIRRLSPRINLPSHEEFCENVLPVLPHLLVQEMLGKPCANFRHQLLLTCTRYLPVPAPLVPRWGIALGR